MKKTLVLTNKILIAMMLILTMLFAFVACKNTTTVENDDDYAITLAGIGEQPIVITKGKIKQFISVEFKADKPAFASDKTDLDGKLIPHTLKGVYLDDILKEYGFKSADFSAINVKSIDSYEVLLAKDSYDESVGGSKIILAYEYDGVALNPEESSGSIRLVLHNQEMNTWVKKVKSIDFTASKIVVPQPKEVLILESLFNEQNIKGSFVDKAGVTQSGVSLFKMEEQRKITFTKDSYLKFYAWDKELKDEQYFTKEYTGFRGYDYFKNAFFYYEEGVPTLDKQYPPNADLKGMKVKNLLSVSIEDKAFLSLQTAFLKFGETANEIAFKQVLDLTEIQNATTYIVVCEQGNMEITAEDLTKCTLQRTQKVYTLKVGEKVYSKINSIKIKE
ncbi:MAG: molybdopterin-dependent oxidoreductase [Clostridia bacterium]